MQAARRNESATEATITIVGDDDAGALAAALRRLGPAVRHGALTDPPERLARGVVLAVGIAAADGGATLRRRLGPDTRLVVVLPADSLSTHLEALRLGATVVRASVAADTAHQVVEQLGAAPHAPLGWTPTEELVEAIAARLAARLGTGRTEGSQIKLGDGRALADAIEKLGDTLADLSAGTRVIEPVPRPVSASAMPTSKLAPVGVSDLDWEDDPQTMKADLAEVEQYRKLIESEPPRDESGVVATQRAHAAELETSPRSSFIRPVGRREEPVVTLASNASSIELPALPGEAPPAADEGPALPPVLDPYAPPPKQASVPPMLERWKADTQLPRRLDEPAPRSLPIWAVGLLVSLLGIGALAAWWLLG